MTILVATGAIFFANIPPISAEEIPGEPTGHQIAINVDEREDGDGQISEATWPLMRPSTNVNLPRQLPVALPVRAFSQQTGIIGRRLDIASCVDSSRANRMHAMSRILPL